MTTAQSIETTQVETTAQGAFPWFVCLSPDFYDDPDDTGYYWEGVASTSDQAVSLALAACWDENDLDPVENPIPAPDDSSVSIHVCEIDWRGMVIDLLQARRTGDMRQALAALESAAAPRFNLPPLPDHLQD